MQKGYENTVYLKIETRNSFPTGELLINRPETVDGVKLTKSDSGLYFEIALKDSLGHDTNLFQNQERKTKAHG